MPGVRLYISDFKRSLPDKLAKDFFSEPSQASRLQPRQLCCGTLPAVGSAPCGCQ